MAMSWLTILAAGAPVPVYAVMGPNALAPVERLLARPGLRRVASPRAAAVLLVAGDVIADHREALDRVHDQVPAPRAVVEWDALHDPPEREILDRWREILGGAAGAPDRLPDTPPNPWKGEGDFGQGGEGMMGGVPYGRPMAMAMQMDPGDGLQLDSYTARFGPFSAVLPPGLTLEVTLKGDLLRGCKVLSPPYSQGEDADTPALCAARMLRLLGLADAADRLIRGKAPRTFGALRAVPPGLATLGETDARARLARWLEGVPAPADAAALFDALEGLEWSEAMLALNSVTPGELQDAAVAARGRASHGAEEADA